MSWWQRLTFFGRGRRSLVCFCFYSVYITFDLACFSFQAVPPLEFAFKNDRITLAIVGAVISPPMVPKGSICKEQKVYPAECRGRRSTYRGKLMVSKSVRNEMMLHHILGILICPLETQEV